jgi:hypothetical protein
MVKHNFFAVVTGSLLAVGCMQVGAADSNCVMNDNYCDCGHDEPETSACSFYSSDLFTCKSTVFKDQKIPLSRVDGKWIFCYINYYRYTLFFIYYNYI